jgi:hypothetical protein
LGVAGEVKSMSGTSVPARERAENITNPYVVGRPLTGASASLYVGREDVFAWLAENLDVVGPPNALLLYGERRIGKTSTLYQLVEGPRGRPLREGAARRLWPAYVDLQRLAGCHTDEWLRRLARDIYRQVAHHRPSRAMPRSLAGEDSAYAAFDRALDHLEQHLPAGDLILLAVDELEQLRAGIDAGALDPAVAPFLRSQAQHRSRLALVFSGSYGLLDDSWRPLIDLTARYELRPLDFEAVAALIRAPLAGELSYDDAAVEQIWQQTGGRPFPIQAICHRLVSMRNRQGRREPIDGDEVLAVLAEMAGGGNEMVGNGLGRAQAAGALSLGSAP